MCVVLFKRHNLYKVPNKYQRMIVFNDTMINVIIVRWFVPLSNGKIGRKADILYFIPPVILAILKCPCHKGMAALVSMDVYHIQREH